MSRSIKVDQVADAFVSVPGVTVSILAGIAPATNQTVAAAVYEDIDANYTDLVVVVPVSGLYMLQLSVAGIYANNGNDVRFRILDGATPITTDDKRWELSTNTQRESVVLQEPVELTAGAHTLTVQWERSAGSGTVTLDTPCHLDLRATMVSGSGAGGEIVAYDHRAVNSDPITVVDPTYEYPVESGSGPQMFVKTVTVSEGEELIVEFSGMCRANTAAFGRCHYRLTEVGVGPLGGGQTTSSADTLSYGTLAISRKTGPLSAGSHTFALEVNKWNAGEANWLVQTGALIIRQMRGGLVPWERDGVAVLDTPRAINVIGGAMSVADDGSGKLNIELPEAVTAPGVTISSYAPQPVSTIAFDTVGVQFFPGASGSATLEVPVTGLYRVVFSGPINSSLGTARIKLVFDEGTGEEQTIGYTTKWQTRIGSDYQWPYFTDTIELSAGSHTLKGYGKEINGAVQILGSSTQPTGECIVVLDLISGSGAGGTLVSQATLTADFVTPSEDNWHAVSGLSNTFETSEGETVQLCFGLTLERSATCTLGLAYRVDGGSWVVIETRGGQYGDSFTGSMPIPNLSAGSHTVEIGVYTDYGTLTVRSSATQWYSTDRQTYAAITRYRGGLVPVRKDGETIVDKPAAFDFVGPGCQVTNVGGTAKIALTGAEGVDRYEASVNGITVSTESPNYDDLASVDVYLQVGECVIAMASGRMQANSATAHAEYVRIYDATEDEQFARVSEQVDHTWQRVLSISGISSPATTAGTHTIKLQGSTSSASYTWDVQYTVFEVARFRGGYVHPENVPILEYSSASQVSVKSGPGASSELRVLLNDGKRYTATSPLTIDLTVSGLGGLDTGSEASNTWYYAYLVPNATGDGLSVLCSVTDPGSGGPTGYSIWKYIGSFRNDGSSNILSFTQEGNEFRYSGWKTVYSGNGAGYVEPESAYAEIPLDDHIPATATLLDWYCYMDMPLETPPPYWQLRWSCDGANFTYALLKRGISSGGTSANASTNFRIPVSSNRSIWRRRYRDTGSLNLGWISYNVLGWVDGYLDGAQQAQAQAPYTPDTKSPKGTWLTTTTVGFGARAGQPSTTRLTLQDGVQRTMTTGTWDVANGVADWGYDEAASQGNTKWLYFYAVPKSGDDSQLVVRASDNPPSTGPTGYSNWKLVWTTYMMTTDALRIVHQSGNEFLYQSHLVDVAFTSIAWNETWAESAIDLEVPLSSCVVILKAFIKHSTSLVGAQIALLVGPEGASTLGGWLISPYVLGSQDANSQIGRVPIPGVASKKIAVRNDDFGGTSAAALDDQEITFLGWVDEWIDP